MAEGTRQTANAAAAGSVTAAAIAATHLAHWPVCLQEVWLEEHVKQVACDALDGVINGQHVHLLAILDVSALQQRPEATNTMEEELQHERMHSNFIQHAEEFLASFMHTAK
jgi:hypothetical protein